MAVKYTKLDRLKATNLQYVKLEGDWDRFRKLIVNLTPGFRRALKAAARKNAKFLIKEIKKGMKNQAPGGETFAPLHDLTIQEKSTAKGIGSTKSGQALIRYGDLYNSISYDLDEIGGFKVGIPKDAVSRDGDDLNMVAAVMEGGITISVSDKMRDYFAAQGRPLKQSTTHLEIPARPFLEPVFEANKEKIYNNYRDTILRVLYGQANITNIESIIDAGGKDDE